MKIILLEKVVNLGELGDVADVKAGYARNFLIPMGKAVRATAANIKEFETKREIYLRRQDESLAIARERQQKLHGQVFTVGAKAGVDGKLFGSVGAIDIINAAQKVGMMLSKTEIMLPHGAFKTLGEFDVTVILHHNVEPAVIRLNVISEVQ